MRSVLLNIITWFKKWFEWHHAPAFDGVLVQSVIIRRARNFMTLVVGVSLLGLSTLGFFGHLSYTVEHVDPHMMSLVDDGFWSGVFLVAGLLTMISFRIRSVKATAMSFAGAAYLGWGLIESVYVLGTVRPVSWVAAYLAISMGLLSIGLANSWSVVIWEKRIRDVQP